MTYKEAIDILVDVYIDCSPCKHTSEQIKEAACLACQALEVMGQIDQITEGLEISSGETCEKNEIEELKATMTNAEAIKIIKSIDFYTIEDKVAFDLAIKALEREEGWISVNDRLPKERDWYLGIFKENDTGWINPIPFVCDYVGHKTPYTTSGFWILHGLTDIDNGEQYYKDLVCVAWQPLPKPYEEEAK